MMPRPHFHCAMMIIVHQMIDTSKSFSQSPSSHNPEITISVIIKVTSKEEKKKSVKTE